MLVIIWFAVVIGLWFWVTNTVDMELSLQIFVVFVLQGIGLAIARK